MTPEEKLHNLLADAGLGPQVVSDAMACFRPRAVRRRSVFARAGEVDARLGFVASGLFAMEVVHEEGGLFIKDFLGEGSFLLASFDPEQENLVTLRAIRDAWVLEARYADILALQERHPAFGTLARRGMERRYQDLCARLERLAGQPAETRYRTFREDFRILEKDIPLNLVAAYLSITPTQLSRIRKGLNLG